MTQHRVFLCCVFPQFLMSNTTIYTRYPLKFRFQSDRSSFNTRRISKGMRLPFKQMPHRSEIAVTLAKGGTKKDLCRVKLFRCLNVHAGNNLPCLNPFIFTLKFCILRGNEYNENNEIFFNVRLVAYSYLHLASCTMSVLH